MNALRRITALACIGALSTAVAACSSSSTSPTNSFIGEATVNQLLSQKIHHVFVLVQENHTFDNYFGTYPGANGFSSATSAALNQYDPVSGVTVKPFKVTDPDELGPDNDREVTIAKEDGGVMDKWVSGEVAAEEAGGATPAEAEQDGLTTISYYDCDTIPYLWMYAKNFTLYDNYFQADTGPSTPSNLQVFSSQVGQTQYEAHPSEVGSDSTPGVPVLIDDDPAYGPGNSGQLQIPLDFATMPVLLGGTSDSSIATAGTFDVNTDLTTEAAPGRAPIQWVWAEEGFNAPTTHDYVAHHVAPQYFDYIRNTTLWNNVEDTSTLLGAIQGGTLASKGVYYIKGGRTNPYGLKPANPAYPNSYLGDDDHPGSSNSDEQIAESFVARVISTIASSPYWSDSAIILTWDDNGGYYDHVAPQKFETCPDGSPCGDGSRMPAIVISPYSQTGVVLHDLNDHASISKFIETVFGLPTMASLPFESQYDTTGEGPRDGNPTIGNLSSAFDPNKLAGTAGPVSSSQAIISQATFQAIPSPWSCKTLGITPVAGPSTSAPPQFQPQKWKLIQPVRNEKDD
jgi:phospholipase C